MRTDKITAIVPVRAGSRRMPNKNLAPFGGPSLLEHKVSQLCEFLPQENVFVSSDSQEMLQVAESMGVRSHRRPKEFADDLLGRPLGETIAFIASEVPGEHILWAQATSPLVSKNSYLDAIEAYLSALDEGFDSLISVERVRDYLRGPAGPINYQTGQGHTPSQLLPEMYRLTYGIVMAPREDMMRWGYYYGDNPKLFEVDKFEGVDIDDKFDFELALALKNLIKSKSAN